jgi:ADP-dependent NAD(P)H-hydrate dehydratase / NAD(P)H-hydrate epimerase
MSVYTVDQMRALEKASDEAGHSYSTMMEIAGTAVARAVEAWSGQNNNRSRQVLVLAGPGNNGGDGLVAARELAILGYSVIAYVWNREKEDPLIQRARRHQVSVIRAESDENEQLLRRALARVDIVIDALFGTGLSRPVSGMAASILQALQEARQTRHGGEAGLAWVHEVDSSYSRPASPFVVAVDIPSGLHGDTGQVDDQAVEAGLTVTFAGPKIGMLVEGAAAKVGKLVVADIGIPDEISEAATHVARLLTPELASAMLPARLPDGHKGTFGTTLVIGGSMNYVGAPALSAMAAGRSGAGMVALGVPAPLHPSLTAHNELVTAIWLLLPHDMGVLRASALQVLQERLEAADALVLGPGLGSESTTFEFIWALLGLGQPSNSRAPIGFTRRAQEDAHGVVPALSLPPTVVDADGLNALAARDDEWWQRIEADLVLTPHPGEMARLLDRETRAVQADRIAAAREAAERFQQVIILKGAYTLVAAPGDRLSIAPYANDALGKAGAGDVLSGMIGALLGQGIESYEAACIAVTAHGLAGEVMKRRSGGRAAVARDLIDALPEVWQFLDRLR